MDKEFQKELEESLYLHRPLKEHKENGGRRRWLEKTVRKALTLPMYERFDRLELHGPATIRRDSSVTRSGEGSICIETDTTLPVKNPSNRYYDITVLTNRFPAMDLSEYNRFSVWVYVDAPCFESLMLQFAMINEGEKILPEPGRFVGIHHDQVIPGAWHHVIWEMPELPRDKVTGFTIQIPVQGILPGGEEKIRVYAEDMRVETVEAENAHGFNLRKNAIAYCHSGYLPNSSKQALVQRPSSHKFFLRNESGEIIYEGESEPASSDAVKYMKTLEGEDAGGFEILDFTEVKGPCRVRLEIGELKSGYFDIGEDAFLPAAWKLLNFFYTERCGEDIPGVHAPCHLDIVCRHPDGRLIPAFGGWHDAADLTLGAEGTARHIISMLELAEAIKKKVPALYERLLEEVRFGLNFLVRTRFGDGYRFGGSIVGIWTDNVMKDFDDITVNAENSPKLNLLSAAAMAMAAPHFEEDRVFSHLLKKCAREDFDFAYNAFLAEKDSLLAGGNASFGASDAARISLLALSVYRLFGEERMLTLSIRAASLVHACQELKAREDFALLLRGFFYETSEKKRILNFFHQSNEHELTECFVRLLEICPEHPEAENWRLSVAASAEYYKKTGNLMPLYGILPAGLYELDNTDYSHIYHEGEKVGLPSLEEYNEETKNGIPMTDRIFLRRFPVAYQFRGFNVTESSKAKAAFILAEFTGDRELYDIGARQLEYFLGRNPFAMSTVYGEGYDYPPLYAGFLGDMVGAAPVGIETFECEDAPYMPMQNNCTYKEVWTHAAGFLMELIAKMHR